MSFDEHERLALAMLAVEAGEVADLRDAMWSIITSAPDATDVALVLLLAISHAEDRALGRPFPCRSILTMASGTASSSILSCDVVENIRSPPNTHGQQRN